MKKFVLGISGYIGSGKTLVGHILTGVGVQFIDADEVVDTLYLKGHEGYRKIQQFFGEEYLTGEGELNRKKLAKVVFSDPNKLRILHALIHPLVTTEIQKMVDKSHSRFIAIEATYFEKKHLRKIITALLWVECRKAVLFRRFHRGRKLQKDLFEKILRIQVKPGNIDYVIQNNGTRVGLKKTMTVFWKKIVERENTVRVRKRQTKCN